MAIKVSTRVAIAIKAFLTLCGMTGLALMYYDWKEHKDCDLSIYTQWATLISLSIGVLGMSAKFMHEIYKGHNCFFSPSEGFSVTEVDEHDPDSAPGSTRATSRSRRSPSADPESQTWQEQQFLRENEVGAPYDTFGNM